MGDPALFPLPETVIFRQMEGAKNGGCSSGAGCLSRLLSSSLGGVKSRFQNETKVRKIGAEAAWLHTDKESLSRVLDPPRVESARRCIPFSTYESLPIVVRVALRSV